MVTRIELYLNVWLPQLVIEGAPWWAPTVC
jgi:hypothetical protein